MWRDIIERDEFAMMHLDMYNKNSDNTCMLAIETRFDQVGPGKESVWVVDHGYTLQKITDLTPISSSFKVRASLNGLLLLGTTSIDDKMLLWNPSIRQHITIPPIPSFHLCDACLGLGRNSTSRDYIVLAMIHPWVSGDELPGPVLVYSVRNGCWRTLSCAAPVLRERGQKKCFVSGHIYWLARHYQGQSTERGDGSWKCVSFDVCEEVFNCVDLPPTNKSATTWWSSLYVLGDSIAFCHRYSGSFCIWVMGKEGNTQSWIRRATVNLHLFFATAFCFLRWNDELLLGAKGCCEMDMCDINTGKITKLARDAFRIIYYEDDYIESLVLLKRERNMWPRLANQGQDVEESRVTL